MGDPTPEEIEAQPKRIWLQWDMEGDPVNETSYCVDKINENDVEYTRADLIRAAVEAETERICRVIAGFEKLSGSRKTELIAAAIRKGPSDG